MQCPFSNCVVNVLLKHFDLKITFLRRIYRRKTDYKFRWKPTKSKYKSHVFYTRINECLAYSYKYLIRCEMQVRCCRLFNHLECKRRNCV